LTSGAFFYYLNIFHFVAHPFYPGRRWPRWSVEFPTLATIAAPHVRSPRRSLMRRWRQEMCMLWPKGRSMPFIYISRCMYTSSPPPPSTTRAAIIKNVFLEKYCERSTGFESIKIRLVFDVEAHILLMHTPKQLVKGDKYPYRALHQKSIRRSTSIRFLCDFQRY
jgi:hypothetical protein